MFYKRSEIKYVGGIYPERSEGSIEVPKVFVSDFLYSFSPRSTLSFFAKSTKNLLCELRDELRVLCG